MTGEYLLMNRELPMLRFTCERNAFDEPEFYETEWLTELRSIRENRLDLLTSLVQRRIGLILK